MITKRKVFNDRNIIERYVLEGYTKASELEARLALTAQDHSLLGTSASFGSADVSGFINKFGTVVEGLKPTARECAEFIYCAKRADSLESSLRVDGQRGVRREETNLTICMKFYKTNHRPLMKKKKDRDFLLSWTLVVDPTGWVLELESEIARDLTFIWDSERMPPPRPFTSCGVVE